jgi:predicted RNA-binding Zn ribbon-like protein
MQTTQEEEWDGVREELCIRFVNTVAWRLRDPQEERLPSSDALLDWLLDHGLCTHHHRLALWALWREDGGRQADFYLTALKLREAIYRLLSTLITEELAPREALTLLNAWLVRPSPGIALAPVGRAFGWRLSATADDPLDMLRPIAISAVSLMTGPRAQRVRQCSDDRGCGWLFIDESRAQNRRWCAMGDCGNRAKAARHRARKKIAARSQE